MKGQLARLLSCPHEHNQELHLLSCCHFRPRSTYLCHTGCSQRTTFIFPRHSLVTSTKPSVLARCIACQMSEQMPVSCRLFSEGQQSRLLSFPDDFNQDLYLWLQRRSAASSALTVTAALRHLMWLHELRLKKYDAAAGTLADVTNRNEVRLYQGLPWPSLCRTVPCLIMSGHIVICMVGSSVEW